jgi:acyl carrier protein
MSQRKGTRRPEPDPSHLSHREISTIVVTYLEEKRPDLHLFPMNSKTRLIDQRILDSMLLAELLAYLEVRFSVAVEPEELTPTNFATPGAIAAFVVRKRRQIRRFIARRAPEVRTGA